LERKGLAHIRYPPTLVELDSAIRKLTIRKATGPDKIPNELFKNLDGVNRRDLLNLFREWWTKEEIPKETLKSRVVFIRKKGDTSNLNNYRPISLSNTIYKIYARILQQRIAEGIDEALQETQYGFRAGKSTSDAIHIIRRIMDMAERAGENINLLLIDWEKAFDKISHDGLINAPARMEVPQKYINIIRNIYENAFFRVEIEGTTSRERQQKSGIRQGCPLSPYLFLIVMKVIMKDVHEEDETRVLHRRSLMRPPGASFDEILCG